MPLPIPDSDSEEEIDDNSESDSEDGPFIEPLHENVEEESDIDMLELNEESASMVVESMNVQGDLVCLFLFLAMNIRVWLYLS